MASKLDEYLKRLESMTDDELMAEARMRADLSEQYDKEPRNNIHTRISIRASLLLVLRGVSPTPLTKG